MFDERWRDYYSVLFLSSETRILFLILNIHNIIYQFINLFAIQNIEQLQYFDANDFLKIHADTMSFFGVFSKKVVFLITYRIFISMKPFFSTKNIFLKIKMQTTTRNS